MAILQLSTSSGWREQLKGFERRYNSINSVMDSNFKVLEWVDATDMEITPATMLSATTPMGSPIAEDVSPPRDLLDDFHGANSPAQTGTPPQGPNKAPPPHGPYYFKSAFPLGYHERLKAHYSDSGITSEDHRHLKVRWYGRLHTPSGPQPGGEVPTHFGPLIQALAALPLHEDLRLDSWSQAQVTIYEPGGGVTTHVDHESYGEPIAIASFVSQTVISFTEPSGSH